MITKQAILKYVCVIGLGFALNVGCSSDDSGGLPEVPEQPEEGELTKSDGISEDELETFMGEIGILLDARPYIRKGQPVAKMKVTPIDSDLFESVILEVDPYTNYARYKLGLENLPAEAETALRNGIDLEVDLLDENDNELFKETLENTLFTENGSNVLLRGDDAEDLNTEIYLMPATPYFLQLVTDDGQIESKALDNHPGLVFGEKNRLIPCEDINERYSRYPSLNSEAGFSSNNDSQQFYFQKHEGEENIYSILSKSTGTYLQIEPVKLGQVGVASSTKTRTSNLGSLSDSYKFKFKKVNNNYQIMPYGSVKPFTFNTSENSCVLVEGDLIIPDIVADFELTRLISSFSNENGQNFRIVTSDVAYQAENIETWYGQPILPGSSNDFKYNSTLKNCTSNDLEQEINIEVKESTTMSVSWEETIGLTSSAKSTTSVSVSAEAGVSFFGQGGKVSGTVTQELELSVEVSKSSTVAEGKSTTEENTLLTKRTVIVAPGKEILAYDAVQIYPDIQLPFVQRLKITGRNSEGIALTGNELATQTVFGGFTGTITEIGTNSIEITVRGTTTFKQAVDATSEAFESDAVCN